MVKVAMMQNEWLYDPAYSSYFYLKSEWFLCKSRVAKGRRKVVLFKKWGYMAKDEWQGNYYLTGSGAMATGELVMDDARYIFSDSGELKKERLECWLGSPKWQTLFL